eukprot:2484856-Rhodomonas_salina.1
MDARLFYTVITPPSSTHLMIQLCGTASSSNSGVRRMCAGLPLSPRTHSRCHALLASFLRQTSSCRPDSPLQVPRWIEFELPGVQAKGAIAFNDALEQGHMCSAHPITTSDGTHISHVTCFGKEHHYLIYKIKPQAPGHTEGGLERVSVLCIRDAMSGADRSYPAA